MRLRVRHVTRTHRKSGSTAQDCSCIHDNRCNCQSNRRHSGYQPHQYNSRLPELLEDDKVSVLEGALNITKDSQSKAQVSEFNELRKQFKQPIIFENLDLTNKTLTKIKLDSVITLHSNFSNSDLERSTLDNVQISGDLSGINLRNASLYNADLTGPNLSNAVLKDAYVSEADLTDTHFPGADLTSVDFSYAVLSNSDHRHADLTNANLVDTDLQDTDFRHADLTNTSLGYADLTGADLLSADLTRAILGYSKLTNPNSDLADLTKADLRSSNLTNATLHLTELSDSLFDCSSLGTTNVTTNRSQIHIVDSNLNDVPSCI